MRSDSEVALQLRSSPGLLADCLEGKQMHEWHAASFNDWQAWARRQSCNLVFDSAAVLAAATSEPAPNESGVYFLVWRNALCYVGRAASIVERLDAHRAEGKPFTAAAWILAPIFAAPWIEHAYVETWHPPWNCARTSGVCCPAFKDAVATIARADASAISPYFVPKLTPPVREMKKWELHVLGHTQEMRK